jgi:hypothetical protein
VSVVRDVVVLGVGQLGRMFGGAALASGFRVTPLLRANVETDHEAFTNAAPDAPVVVAVGEAALADAVARVPSDRHGDLVLLQNELFPDVWRALLGDSEPTVVVVWSNVKKGRPVEIGRATAVFGKHASFVKDVHAALDVPCVELASSAELVDELVAKYAFLLGVNALGLEQSRTVGEWLAADRAHVDDVVARFIALAEARAQRKSIGAAEKVTEAMHALRAMPAAGRTAHERLERANATAARLGLAPIPPIV